MPKVGDKEFPYTEEGMAAAQAEAEATGLPIEEDDMASQLPQEEIESEEPAAEEMVEEPQEGSLPSEEIISEVYNVVFGDAFNPGDENSEEQMEMLKSILSADPKLSQMLSSGEMTISDFAVNLYRMMDDKRAALEAPKK
jgi:hypothetical protein